MRFTDYAKELAAKKSLDPSQRTLRPRLASHFESKTYTLFPVLTAWH
jgi:hypothetical protein